MGKGMRVERGDLRSVFSSMWALGMELGLSDFGSKCLLTESFYLAAFIVVSFHI